MTILGIETSTSVCSVGLADEFDLRIERSLVESHIHSEKLLTLINEVCDEQKISLNKIDGIAVSIGPGSFTGLRIGLSSAKGLAYSLRKPLIAVPTFFSIAAYALKTHPDFNQIIICIDAKQGEYYIGVYENRDGMIYESIPVGVRSLSSIKNLNCRNTICITDCVNEIEKNTDFEKTDNVIPYCNGGFIALEAAKRWIMEKKEDWHSMEPMYLKDFKIR